VNTCANVTAELPDRFRNCPPATDSTCWAIGRGQEAVAGRVDLATAMLREALANKGVVLREKVLPSLVTDFDRFVASTISVNRMVASTRSLLVSISRRWPVRNDSISPRIESESPTYGVWSLPRNSTYLTPLI
jgi:hypothetical protein